jgi:hypothetical protein
MINNIGMKLILCMVLILLVKTVHSQPDTLALKKQVENIYTEKNHQDFWEFIYDRDQNMFQSDRIEAINLENLILVSYYFNKFGYPDFNVLGDKSKIINLVWVHNKYYEIKKITYPIILQGYLKKGITEFNLREYYLRILYKRYFDDHGNMTKPLSQIYKELAPNLSSQIDVREILKIYSSNEKYFSQEKKITGMWKSEDLVYNGFLKGDLYSHSISGGRVTIYKMPDGKYFFESLYPWQSVDPEELKPANDSNTVFQFANAQSLKYYQITKDGDLVYKDEAGLVLETFHPEKQR